MLLQPGFVALQLRAVFKAGIPDLPDSLRNLKRSPGPIAQIFAFGKYLGSQFRKTGSVALRISLKDHALQIIGALKGSCFDLRHCIRDTIRNQLQPYVMKLMTAKNSVGKNTGKLFYLDQIDKLTDRLDFSQKDKLEPTFLQGYSSQIMEYRNFSKKTELDENKD